MSYSVNLNKFSRMSQRALKVNPDACDNTYGVAPCTATAVEKCYKTLSTCTDPDNYLTTTGVNIQISMAKKLPPFAGEVWRPLLIKEPGYRATEIDPANSLTKSARISYDFLNPTSNDIGIDPHVSDRSTYPGNVGPFWDLFFTRNKYYIGRPVYDLSGFHGDIESEYVSRRFMIDQVKFNTDGTCRVICKDLMKEADKVDVPLATDGKIADNPLVAGAATINMSTDTDMTQYDSAGYIHAGGEGENIIQYTGISAQQFTGCTWQKFGTSQVNASQDTKVQQCYVKVLTNVTDIMVDIIQNEVGFAAGDINTAEFTSEKTTWLSAYTFTVCWTKPAKASTRLRQLQEQSGSNIWWDEELEKVRFKVFAPEPPGSSYVSLNETSNIKSITTDFNEASRVSRAILYFDLIDNTKDLDDPASYRQAAGDVSVTSEDVKRYGSKAIKQIFADGVPSSSIATAIVSRYKRRFLDPPKKFNIIVERKNADLDTAQIVALTTRRNIAVNGSQVAGALFQVLKRQPKTPGTMTHIVMDTKWSKRYGYICPAGYPDWDSATDDQRQRSFIGDINNLLGIAKVDGDYLF